MNVIILLRNHENPTLVQKPPTKNNGKNSSTYLIHRRKTLITFHLWKSQNTDVHKHLEDSWWRVRSKYCQITTQIWTTNLQKKIGNIIWLYSNKSINIARCHIELLISSMEICVSLACHCLDWSSSDSSNLYLIQGIRILSPDMYIDAIDWLIFFVR